MRPVWSFTLQRTTNAPLERVAERLKDGADYGAWHPRHGRADLEIAHEDASRLEVLHRARPLPGVEECERYVVTRRGEGLVLAYEARFKGWPVLLMMSWWRIASDKLWERFVERL